MKSFLSASCLIFFILLFTHCTERTIQQETDLPTDSTVIATTKQPQPELKDYIPQMAMIQTPVTFNSDNFDNMSPRDEKLSRLFAFPNGQTLVGKLFSTDQFDALLFSIPADGTYPLAITYDKVGNKIDSLGLIKRGGSDVDFDCVEHVTVNPDRTIVLIDSMIHWKVTPDGGNRVEGSDSLVVTRKAFELLDNGKFKIPNEK